MFPAEKVTPMKTPAHRLISLLSIVAALAAPLTGWAQAPSNVIPGRFIVQLRAGSAGDPAAVANRNGVAVSHVYRVAARGFAAAIPPGLMNRLAADPDVAAIIPD